MTGAGCVAAPERLRTFTPEEYLRLERESETRSEYLCGYLYAMAGGSLPHSEITTNLAWALKTRLRAHGCHVYSSDLRVALEPGSAYVYPDVTVVCGEPRPIDSNHDTIANPTVVAEVLSPSTEAWDRTEKLSRYQDAGTVDHILMVAQDRVEVDHYARQSGDHWLLTIHRRLDGEVWLASLDCRLPVAEIYDQVRLSQQE